MILNQFFYPDHSATSQLMTDLAESLAARGVSLTAICGRGRYDGGGLLAPRDWYKGVTVERAWATSFGKGSSAGRLADYVSFYLGAAWKLMTVRRHDVVTALTTPPMIGLVALLACRLRGMRLALLVQDLYPDVGVRLGVIREGGVTARLLDRVNRITLARADRVIVISSCMRERVAAKVGPESGARIDVIHNWADGERIRPLAAWERNFFAEEHGLGGRFVVEFSGNFGRVNDFATPLEAARLLARRDDILFLFVGGGVRAAEIREFVRRHGLSNVRVLPYQPLANLRYSLAAGDAHLVTLAEGLAGLSVPSKAYGIMAAGRPLIFVGDARSEIARLVAENGCGEVVPSGQPARLARLIEAWAEDPSATIRMGERARELFARRFDRPSAVAAYEESLSNCLGPPSCSGAAGAAPARRVERNA